MSLLANGADRLQQHPGRSSPEEASPHDMDAALLNYFNQLPTPETRQAAIDILRIFSSTLKAAQDC